MTSKKVRVQSRSNSFAVVIGMISFVVGSAVMTVSSMLLSQSIYNHRWENGTEYDIIYGKPFKDSNWMKSSIPSIVVSSFGIVLGAVQILSSLVLILVNWKFRILALVVWIGAHMMIFVFNIICFCLAVSIKSHEYKDDTHYLFWKNYQFRSAIIHNHEGLAFCSILVGNSLFILMSLVLTAPKLYPQKDILITLPKGSY